MQKINQKLKNESIIESHKYVVEGHKVKLYGFIL